MYLQISFCFSLVIFSVDDAFIVIVFSFSIGMYNCRNFKTVPARYKAFKFYVTMAIGVCEGLTEMHGKGFLHRDLKLSNVLVSNHICIIKNT